MNKGANLKFSRTPSLGTVPYKGQRVLVIEAIAKIPDPFNRDQVVAAIDKEAYEKTFTHGTQIVTIPESVQYHLRELTKLRQLILAASPIPVVKPGRGLDFGIGGRTGSENQGTHLAEAYSACILDMALKHYGYGRWDAPYWFIGPEPGQHGCNGTEKRRVDLGKRCEAWIQLGRGELIDCKEHHLGFGETKWHREVPPPLIQPTWKQLIRLLLAYCHGKKPHLDDIRSYQQKCWGTENGETCVIELSSLAAPGMDAPGPHGLFREQRIEEIRKKIRRHKPRFVVMYGVRQKRFWEAIASAPFSTAPDIITLENGTTLAVFANHPVDSVGVSPHYWLQLAKTLRQKLPLF
jgi:hypothetical protein